MNYEPAMKLVAALRSGKYKQGRVALRSAADCYCVLGVAHDVLGDGWQPLLGGQRSVRTRDGWVSCPPKGTTDTLGLEPYGFGYIPVAAQEEFGLPHSTLSSNNDSGITFGVLADVIEKYWEDIK